MNIKPTTIFNQTKEIKINTKPLSEQEAEVIADFNLIDKHIVSRFFEFVAKGYSFRECELVLSYIGRMQLATMQDFVFINDKYYSLYDRNYVTQSYKDMAIELLEGFGSYHDDTSKEIKELFKEIVSNEEIEQTLIAKHESREITKEQLNELISLVELNKYLPPFYINRLKELK